MRLGEEAKGAEILSRVGSHKFKLKLGGTALSCSVCA